MFFFKKKTKSAQAGDNEQTAVVDPALQEQVVELKQRLETAEGDLRIATLNELGSKLFALENIDEAIQFYETSIQENRTLGKAYTDLLKLYNVKRKQAAEQNDDDKLQTYLNKIDDLMKLSKDVIRGLE
ncbi:hypothetical protein P22_1443 [Propionispora sp. 2/2-37]|uniref:hypothetical protein n=1 Tax=Propionispora sp. 2/2-37 TaxID=1677858 RepID=UPI0006BB972E|nr:hypothetical protein [Propionispora sp. 2/2-37]CUH95373.1 hypothetical protein P22_1443 [Propionispora sp. 2/2-37]